LSRYPKPDDGGIRGKNTKPELIVRRALHAHGFRYRLHASELPGKPDLVFPKFRAVIFVHGCFGHGHECHLFRWPGSRVEFWKKKLSANIERDLKIRQQLTENGWRICEIWECALSGRERRTISEIVEHCSEFLKGVEPFLSISSEQIGRIGRGQQ
jgi:DNA mismatch endonuclease, patch repair protein